LKEQVLLFNGAHSKLNTKKNCHNPIHSTFTHDRTNNWYGKDCDEIVTLL